MTVIREVHERDTGWIDQWVECHACALRGHIEEGFSVVRQAFGKDKHYCVACAEKEGEHHE